VLDLTPVPRRLALAAGLLCLALPAQAQTQVAASNTPSAFTIAPSDILAISSPANRCGVEQHSKAIDPALVECHAAFAPVPVIPPLIKDTTPEQRDAAGRWLVSQLDRPGVCGKGAKIDAGESCAALIYVLHQDDRKTGIPLTSAAPWVYVVNIYRISHPEDQADATLFTINSNASEGRFGPGKDPVWQLLAEQRATRRCVEAKTQFLGTGVATAGMRPDQCRGLASQDLRYIPMLVLSHSNASVVLSKPLASSIFTAPMYVVRDVGSALAAFTGANAYTKGRAP
jgi:hypothetical protein